MVTVTTLTPPYRSWRDHSVTVNNNYRSDHAVTVINNYRSDHAVTVNNNYRSDHAVTVSVTACASHFPASAHDCEAKACGVGAAERYTKGT